MGWDSVVGIATGNGLDGPGIESPCRRDFPHPSGQTLGPTRPLVRVTMGTDSLSQGYIGRSLTLNTHPHLAPKLKKSRAVLLPLWAVVACCGATFTLYILWLVPCSWFFIVFMSCLILVSEVSVPNADRRSKFLFVSVVQNFCHTGTSDVSWT